MIDYIKLKWKLFLVLTILVVALIYLLIGVFNLSTDLWIAILTGMVAISTITYTIATLDILNENKKQFVRHRRDELDKYIGLLLGIQAELDLHKITTEKVVEELKQILEIFKRDKKIIFQKSSLFFDVDFLSIGREKIIEYRDYKVDILHVLTYYINNCKLRNRDLDFNLVINYNKSFPNDYEERTVYYFEETINGFSKFNVALDNIIKLIIVEIDSFLSPEQKKNKYDALKNSKVELETIQSSSGDKS